MIPIAHSPALATTIRIHVVGVSVVLTMRVLGRSSCNLLLTSLSRALIWCWACYNCATVILWWDVAGSTLALAFLGVSVLHVELLITRTIININILRVIRPQNPTLYHMHPVMRTILCSHLPMSILPIMRLQEYYLRIWKANFTVSMRRILLNVESMMHLVLQ